MASCHGLGGHEHQLSTSRCIRGAILENSNGDISAADRPIYSVFGSRMGFSGLADTNGANSFLTKFNRCVGENNARVIRLVTI